MAAPLLYTRCALPPERATAVPRPELIRRLDAGLRGGRRLSLISAPAGYGKTTLAGAWVRQARVPTVWLTLDAHDNDVVQLLRYLRLGMRRLRPDAGERVAGALDAPQPPPVEELVAVLLDDLADVAATEGGRILLALDDAQRLDRPAAQAFLALLVEHLSPSCHLLLISREDPALPLPRLRVRGELTEIRAQDLRFTAVEAAQFLTEAMQLHLEPEWIAALERRTEGWIASLQLAAISLQGRSAADAAAFIRAFSGSHRFVFDYLAEEVLAQQPAEVRAFLQQTAALDRFHAPLCRALTGRADSQAMLQHLEQANLFLISLDDERTWYRYHHLFADYLRGTLPAGELPRLQNTAARWCAEAGLAVEAVQYALSGGDPELIGAVVEGALQRAATWSGGELAMLVRWIDALPGQVLQAHPRLCLDASRALFLSGRPTLAEHLIAKAEAALVLRTAPPLSAPGDGRPMTGALPAPSWPSAVVGRPSSQLAPDSQTMAIGPAPAAPAHEELLATAAIYRAALAAFQGQVRRAITMVTEARPRLPAGATLAHARAADTLGLAYALAGDLAQAERWYAEASLLGQSAGVSYLAINARCEVAMARLGQGRMEAAAQTCHEALALAGGAPLPPTGLVYTILGEIAYEQDDLAAAERSLLEGLARGRQGGLSDDLRLAHLLLARLRIAQGDLDAAAAAVEQAAALMPARESLRLARLADAWRTQIELARGNSAAARRWAQAYTAYRAAGPGETSEDTELLTLAWACLDLGDPAQALAVARDLQRQAQPAGRVRSLIAALILQALAHQMRREQPAGLESLTQALQLAAPAGFVRPFRDAGPALAALLPLARVSAPQLVERLLAGVAVAPPPRDQLAGGPDALSEQELRVLRLIVAGQSNQEIAEALVISVGTAKWHVHNILQKLGVGSRPKAIARAHELGLV